MSVRCQTDAGSFPTLRRWQSSPGQPYGAAPAAIPVKSSTLTPALRRLEGALRHSRLLPTATPRPREGKQYLHFTDKEKGAFQAHVRTPRHFPNSLLLPHTTPLCSFRATQGVHSPRSRDFGRRKGKAAAPCPTPPPLGRAGSSLPGG